MSDIPQKGYDGNEDFFIFGGKTFKAAPYSNCSDCFFWGLSCVDLVSTEAIPGCVSSRRMDGREVIFVETQESLL